MIAPLAVLLAVSAGGVPFLAGRVTDDAGMIGAAAEERIEARLSELERDTGAQLAVLTVDTLAGEAVESFALRVAETWALGRKGVDDGALFLVVRDDRRMRLEVGYGLEASLTDAACRRILDDIVRPRFRSGDMDGGFEAGVEAASRVIRGETLPPAPADDQEVPLLGAILAGGVFLLVMGVFSTVALFGRGCQGWFLYLFLLPFWTAFPAAFVAPWFALATGGLWLLGFPAAKLWLVRSGAGRAFLEGHPALVRFATSSGSGGSSRSGSSFSGGGGSFGGGGASSSW